MQECMWRVVSGPDGKETLSESSLVLSTSRQPDSEIKEGQPTAVGISRSTSWHFRDAVDILTRCQSVVLAFSPLAKDCPRMKQPATTNPRSLSLLSCLRIL